jgi:uncharacterized membrane protein
MTTDLSFWAVLLGGILVVLFGLALVLPEMFRNGCRKFLRSRSAAWVLVTADICWSAWLLYNEPMPRLEDYKPWLWLAAPVSILLIGFFVDELLAPRALGGLMLLTAAPVLFAARFNPSSWRLFMSVFGYVIVIAGIVFVLAPYQFRNLTGAWFASGARRLTGTCLGLLAGAAMLALGLLVY